MPIPLLVGAALVAAGYGVKKGLDAKKDNEAAQELNQEAATLFERAQKKLIVARDQTTATLEELGRLKLNVWHEDIGRFVRVFETLHHVELSEGVSTDELRHGKISYHDLSEMKSLSLKATEVVVGGIAALGTGALVGIASYGGAMMFATASTGTAISALAGAAATNATLAWFGGGALAAGGLGMAGGAAVLGGIVAGPVIAVGGLILAAKAKENLANAKSNMAEARVAVAEFNQATSVVQTIQAVGQEFYNVTSELRKRLMIAQIRFETVVDVAGTDYSTYTTAQKQTVYQAFQLAQVMKQVLETPILTTDGGISPDYVKGLSAGMKFLQ